MQLKHKSKKIMVTGVSGTGKSTLFYNYFLNAKYNYKFLFDSEGEFSFRFPNIPICHTLDNIAELLEQGHKVIVYDPSSEFQSNLESAFDLFSQVVFDLCEVLEGIKLFGSDELQNVNAVSFIPDSFSSILETGRRRGLDSIFVVQSPNLAHNRLRNQISDVVAFSTRSVPALKSLITEFGFDGEEERLQSLPDGSFLEINLKTGEKFVDKIF